MTLLEPRHGDTAEQAVTVLQGVLHDDDVVLVAGVPHALSAVRGPA